MSIKIVIERKFKEPPTEEDLRLIDEIRVKALRDRGYIGGETIVSADDDREVVVLSAWSSAEDWNAWYEKKEWEELEKKLSPQLDQPARIKVFMPGADYGKKAFE